MPRFSVIIPCFKVRGLPARVPRLRPGPVLPGHRGHRRERLLAGRLRRDPRRVRRPRRAGAGAAPGGERGPRPGPQRRAPARHRRLPLLPRQRRHPHPGRSARDGRPARGDGRPGRPGLRLRAHLLVGRHAAQRPGRGAGGGGRRHLHGRRAPRDPRPADGGLEQGLPARLRGAGGLHLPAGLLRGHALDLPGHVRCRADRHAGPHLPELPAAPPGQHPVHHQPQALRRPRAVRAGLRLPRRPPGAGPLAAVPARQDG